MVSSNSNPKLEKFVDECFRYIHTKNLEADNIEILKNLKIAFSGSYILKQIIGSQKLNPLHGYSNQKLAHYLQTLVEKCKKHSIIPMVVLDGIQHSSNPKLHLEEKQALIKDTWELISQKKSQEEKFSSNLKAILEENFTENELIPILEQLEIEYIRAPYNSIYQLKWFCEYTYVNLAVCGLEALPYNLNNFIIHIDWQSETFYWVDVRKFLKETKLDIPKVQNLFLVSGFNPLVHRSLWTHKMAQEIIAKDKTELPETCDFLTTMKLLSGDQHPTKMLKDEEINEYHANRRIMEFTLVFNSESDIDVLGTSALDIVQKSYGSYLPHDIYFMFVFNVISKELVDFLVNEKAHLKVPLAESAEFLHLIDKRIKPLWENALGSLTAKLHPSYRKNEYSLFRYYFGDKPFKLSPGKPFKLSSLVMNETQLKKPIEEGFTFTGILRVFAELLNEEQTRRNPSIRKESVDVTQLVTGLAALDEKSNVQQLAEEKSSPEKDQKATATHKPESTATQSEGKKDTIEGPKTEYELAGYVYLSFLENLDLLQTSSKMFMVLGAALRKCDPVYEESLIILLELMKMGKCLINGNELNNSRIRKTSSENPFAPVEKKEHPNKELYDIGVLSSDLKLEQREHIILISRVFSLINPEESTTHQSQEIDYDSSQYLSILNVTQSALRLSFESILVQSYLTNYDKKNLPFLASIKSKLPFRKNFSISLGVAMKKLLQTKESFAEFKEKNPHLPKLEADINKGYQLWRYLVGILKYQEDRNGYNSDLNKIFQDADSYLMSRLRDMKIKLDGQP
mmetsp:Transcript_65473/g.76168  ORF Transcript_65473/g.76168 Transcript_65473/m.76168 type:complete len:797 (+) Transcript_65473:33-2423(+)